MRHALSLVLSVGLLSGCLLNNINPSQKLNERVQEYGDATRWNRLDIAVQMVTPGYRDAFMKRHAAWGRAVEVADAELIHIQIAPDGNTATSTLAYSWYDLSAMTLARTVVRQTWDIRNGYQVMGEDVVEGAAELLPVPATDEDETGAHAHDAVAAVR
jgi:hypothetical protein